METVKILQSPPAIMITARRDILALQGVVRTALLHATTEVARTAAPLHAALEAVPTAAVAATEEEAVIRAASAAVRTAAAVVTVEARTEAAAAASEEAHTAAAAEVHTLVVPTTQADPIQVADTSEATDKLKHEYPDFRIIHPLNFVH